jgi:hypothetical protein
MINPVPMNFIMYVDEISSGSFLYLIIINKPIDASNVL